MASAVWDYFTIDQESRGLYAKCGVCSKLISRGSSKSTSNLKKHLTKQHNLNVKKSDTQSSKKTKLDTTPKSVQQTTSFKSFFQSSVGASTSTSTSFSTTPLSVLTEDEDEDSPCARPTSPESFTSSVASAASLTSTEAALSPGSSTQMSPTQTSPKGLSSPDLYPKVIKKAKKKTHQLTLSQVYDKSAKFKHGDPRANKITDLIGQMICLDLQPFCVVENKGFRQLIEHLEPRYTIPSRKTFGNKIIPEMYSKINESVKKELRIVDSVALTTDMWTSISGNDYMALTCHFYKEGLGQLELCHKCLEVVPFKEFSHTATNLKQFLIDVISEWGLMNKVVAVVRDNGSDIKAALGLTGFKAVSCTAHTLQLVIKDGFFNSAKVNNLVTKCKKVVGSFKHSTKNTKILRRCQKQLGIPEHRMIQDEPTRWNSTFHMLQRLAEQKNAIVLASSSSVDINLSADLTPDDWKTLEFAVEVLEIFEVVTLQLSKEASTISEIIPLIKLILHHLETPAPKGSGLQGLKNDLLSSVKFRFANVETDELLGPATLLDPRFKDKAFTDSECVKRVKHAVVKEMEAAEAVHNPTSSPTHSSRPDSSHSRKGIWATYKNIFSSAQSEPRLNSAADELENYLAELPINPESDPQEVGKYWCRSQHIRLKKLVFKYLCTPPATVFSERLFNTAGNIVDSKRNRLDPERVKMLVFLNKNLK